MKPQMSDNTDSAPDARSVATRFGRPLFRLLLVMVVLAPMLAGTAAAATPAADGGDELAQTNPVCNGNDASSETFKSTLQSLFGLLIIAGPVAGTTVAVFAQVAASGATSSDDASSWMERRKKALIAGWTVPVLIYGMEMLGGVILDGKGISCVIP